MRTLVLALLAASCAEAAAPPLSLEEPLPRFALRRLGTTRYRWGARGAGCLSADGRWFAIAYLDGIRVWDLTTGRISRVVPFPNADDCLPLHFTADGGRLVVDASPYNWKTRERGKLRLVLIDLTKGAAATLVQSSTEELVFSRLDPKGRLLFVGTNSRFFALDLVTRTRIPRWDRTRSPVVEFSADGSMFAVGEPDGSIRLHRFGDDHTVELKGHTQPIANLAFSPDGRRLASFISSRVDEANHPDEVTIGATGAVRVWDVRSGKSLASLRGHGGSLSELRFSPDGRHLAGRDTRSAVVAWRVDPADLIARFPEASAFAFGPDGKRLVVAFSVGELMFYDLATGTRWRSPATLGDFPSHQFTHGGRHLVSLARYGPMLDGITGEPLLSVGHLAPVQRIVFAGRGEFVLTGDFTGYLRAWRADNGTPWPLFGGEPSDKPVCFGVSAGGDALVTVRASGVAEVRRLPSGSVVLRRTLPAVRPPSAFEGFAQPEATAAGGMPLGKVILGRDPLRGAYITRDGWATSFDLRSGAVRRLCPVGHGEWMSGISSDGRLVACPFGQPQELRFHDADSGAEVGENGRPYVAESYPTFRRDGAFVAWNGMDTARILDVRRRELFSLDDASRRARVGDRASGRMLPLVPTSMALGFSPDGNLIVSWPAKRHVGVFDPAARKELRVAGPLRGEARGAMTHPSGLVLITSHDKDASEERQYDLAGERLLCKYPTNPDHMPTIRLISPDGRLLAIGDYHVTLFDTATGRAFARWPCGHVGGVTALAFSPDGRVLASGGDDGTVLLWDWRSACGLAGSRAALPDGPRLEALWRQMGDDDTRSALRAAGELIAHPAHAVELLRDKLQPASASEYAAVEKVIANLDHDAYAKRQAATAWLTAVTEWDFLMRKAMAAMPSLELVKRLERILADADRRDYSPETRRRLLAVWVLEEIGSPAAFAILQRAAGGVETSPLTRRALRAITASSW